MKWSSCLGLVLVFAAAIGLAGCGPSGPTVSGDIPSIFSKQQAEKQKTDVDVYWDATYSMRIRGEDLLAGEDLTAILPLRREILEYFSTEDIANRLTIEDGQDEVLVHFAFPLSGNWEESREYDFVKHYPKKDLIYLQKNVPIVEIWPNIRREGWDKYYLYYENADAQNTQEAGKDFFYVKPWTYGVEDSADVPKDGMNVLSAESDKVELSYRLQAKDRSPSGSINTKYFTGTATMRYMDGGWLISGMESKEE